MCCSQLEADISLQQDKAWSTNGCTSAIYYLCLSCQLTKALEVSYEITSSLRQWHLELKHWQPRPVTLHPSSSLALYAALVTPIAFGGEPVADRYQTTELIWQTLPLILVQIFEAEPISDASLPLATTKRSSCSPFDLQIPL